MHILLTDLLTCPRCGPEFGLVLLAERVEERRVREGRLGCPNCREQYPVRAGVADLRLPGAPAADATAVWPTEDADEAVRLAALLGLAEASGTVLLAGAAAAQAGAMAALLGQVEVVAWLAVPPDVPLPPRVNVLLGGERLPFRDRALRGVASSAHALPPGEALRVVQPGGRLVVRAAAEGAAAALEQLGAQLLLDQDDSVVARAVGEPVQLRLNALR
jgi:uncharacterized protein YbaR (Trm112 family)